ncbi:endonuclease/exonuclease/phosphatase family metal-dependent hydrolase [Rhizobium tibeticum]|uniref:endonuclease/exonuclease/phosphatase family protein n=1 Tax=Rhizobium tibeticum TaxID=501024 RepID=UPI0027866A0D|nr:endonuclease/exonuclease/phosphatase family protein [Rhizobium tibeticum]MDP9812295.1 endonuclease/exonuclease/phosphatase family metal-dependent hydrolase [Rhizobium tibeticum]
MSTIASALSPSDRRELKVLTYNVHSCVGTDRRIDPHRIAAVIARSEADIIALQELDVGRKRTGGIDQAEMIATLLKMEAHFHPALHVEEERYGDAIVTALPTRLMRAAPLPSIGETRGAIWVQVDVHGWSLNVLNTHLGLRNRDRNRQVTALLSDDWIGNAQFQALPAVVCGDLNAIPSSPAYKSLATHFRDAQLSAGTRPRPTFPSRYPLLRIDHVFVSKELHVASVAITADPLTRRASDHLPLLVRLDLGRHVSNDTSIGNVASFER